MTDANAKLRDVRQRFVSQVGDAAYAELYRVARRLRGCGRQTIGLLPASSAVAVSPVAIQLGLLMAEIGDEPVSVVDANTRYPALNVLADQPPDRPVQPEFASVKLADRLWAVFLVGPPTETLDMALIAEAVGQRQKTDGQVFVDLTGFADTGEHLDTFSLLDGLLLVARAAETRQKDLLARHQDLPPKLDLGVLLVG